VAIYDTTYINADLLYLNNKDNSVFFHQEIKCTICASYQNNQIGYDLQYFS